MTRSDSEWLLSPETKRQPTVIPVIQSFTVLPVSTALHRPRLYTAPVSTAPAGLSREPPSQPQWAVWSPPSRPLRPFAVHRLARPVTVAALSSRTFPAPRCGHPAPKRARSFPCPAPPTPRAAQLAPLPYRAAADDGHMASLPPRAPALSGPVCRAAVRQARSLSKRPSGLSVARLSKRTCPRDPPRGCPRDPSGRACLPAVQADAPAYPLRPAPRCW